MSDLTIRAGATTIVASPGEVVLLGREADCALVCSAPDVSRHHAQLWYDDGSWWLRDLDSTHGTWSGGQRITQTAIRDTTTITVGRMDAGDQILLQPAGAAVHPPPTPHSAVSPAPSNPAAVPQPSGSTPTGAADMLEWVRAAEAAGVDLSATVQVSPDDPSLRIQLDDDLLVFGEGHTVHFGRDPACEVASDNPMVSRRHAVTRRENGRWVLRDTQSAQGVYIHDQAVHEHVLTGVTTVWLGPPDAGQKLVLVASGPTVLPGRASNKRSVVIATAAIAAVLIALVAALAFGLGGERNTSSAAGSPDLDSLKLAAVRVEVDFGDGGRSVGSGSVISSEGMILTNAHVIDGDDRPGAQVVVLFYEADDQPMRASYTATVAAVDQYLDLAVLELDAPIGDSVADPTGLTFVPLGDSDLLSVGDDLWVLGHPAVAQATSVTLTTGAVGSFIGDALLGTSRAWINTEASVARGNSGGLAANRAGELVAVPTQIWLTREADGFEERTNRLRPVNLALPMIEAVRAGRAYQPVESPTVELDLTGECGPSERSTEQFIVRSVPVGRDIYYRVLVESDDDWALAESDVVTSEGVVSCVTIEMSPQSFDSPWMSVGFALDDDFTQVIAELRL